MRTLTSVQGIKDPYSRRILSNVVGKDPLAIFRSTPRRLNSLTGGLSMRQLRKSPAKGKWSIAQIVCHLSDVEVVLGWRIRMAIGQSGCCLQVMDQDKWAKQLDYNTRDVRAKLNLFGSLRLDHLRLLKSLTEKQWKRYGMHEERGKETVEMMVQMYAGHDLNHLAQIRHIRQTLLSKTGP